MTKDLHPGTSKAAVYQIRIKGHLGPQWAEWFGGMSITLEESGTTLMTGQVIDQAALHGLLRKVRDLGLPLVSVLRMPAGTRRRIPATQSDDPAESMQRKEPQ